MALVGPFWPHFGCDLRGLKSSKWRLFFLQSFFVECLGQDEVVSLGMYGAALLCVSLN